MFITKNARCRGARSCAGIGVAVSLPLARRDGAGADGAGAGAARPRTRFGAIYVPNGAIMEQWIPERVGAGFEFKPILKPLEPFKDQIVVVSRT